MILNKEKIKKFRRIGHQLSPVVIVSDKGLSAGVRAELERALNDHELIKIKVHCGDRELRNQLIAELLTENRAQLIQAVGNIALIYRPAKKPNAALSNLIRHGNG